MSTTENTPKKSGSNLNFLFILGLIATILVIVFAVQNDDSLDIKFFLWTIPNIPKALLIIGSIAAGTLLSILFGLPSWWRKRRTIKGLQSEVKALEQRLLELEKNKPTEAGS